MDFNPIQPDQGYPNPSFPYRKHNSFAIASLMFGVLAVVSICTTFLPFIFGSLSIIFALLSKGYDKNFTGQSIAGLILSGFSLFLCIVTIISSFAIIYSNPDYLKEYRDTLNAVFEQQYGESYDEWLNENF